MCLFCKDTVTSNKIAQLNKAQTKASLLCSSTSSIFNSSMLTQRRIITPQGPPHGICGLISIAIGLAKTSHRSEEHTSELQSHSFISYAVFCLKKNNTM